MSTPSSQEFADLAKDAYKPRAATPTDKDGVVIGGREYWVLEHADNPRTGYQGTIYQRIDTGAIIVAHRGTEFDREAFKDGALTDGGMVLARTNLQADDAKALTGKALEFAKVYGRSRGEAVPEVTVTGHSLGGTLAQISAHHHGLRGETFNAYGAASLGLRIPEGGSAVINHVMAGDAVSAASPHCGQVRVYARAEEIRTLNDKGYDNRRHWSDALRGYSPAHIATGMTPPRTTAAAISMGGSHSMHHFVDIDGQGRPDVSVLRDPQAGALAQQNAVAIGEYRQDVRQMRSAVTVVARGPGGALLDGVEAWRGPLAPGEPARREQERLSPVSQRLLDDSRGHVRALSDKHGLPWDQGMENTVCAVARCARDGGLEGISHLRVSEGKIRFAQWDGVRLSEAQLNARQAANTPAEQSLAGMLMRDANVIPGDRLIAQPQPQQISAMAR